MNQERSNSSLQKHYHLRWFVADCGENNSKKGKPIPATVPGHIELDFAEYENYPDYQIGDNYKKFNWMENRYFIYEAQLPDVSKQEKVFISCKGIDYQYEIFINNKKIYYHEGMFSPINLEITRYLCGDDKISILIFPIPMVPNARMPRENASQSCKPAVSYGWDFHPHLVPRGIWEDFEIVATEVGFISDFDVNTGLSPDYSMADGKVGATVLGVDKYQLQLKICSPTGDCVYLKQCNNTSSFSFKIPYPQLWWPNGSGKQNLYDFELSLVCGDEKVQTVSFRRGFRTVELVPYDGSWSETGSGYPIKCNSQPVTLCINGKKIFSQGANWVCPEIFYAKLNRSLYDNYLKLVKDANMNILRCWGGAIVNKDSFFELCDEYGILVWQEFPLACNNYHATEDYLNLLDNESRSIIHRLKRFTSLAIWCGGNELFNEWSHMDMQSHVIRLLDSNCLELDRNTPFLPTSPISDIGHGDYRFRNESGEDVMNIYPSFSRTAYCEFGCGAASSLETIRRIIPEEYLGKIQTGTPWETHHAISAWMPTSHMYPDMIFDYFGKCSLKRIIKYSQILQATAFKFIFEEARRQQPRCSMAMLWVLNEPWPTAANNSIIEYGAKPKYAYNEVKKALRNSMPSIRYYRFDYHNGDKVEIELWWLTRDPINLNCEISLQIKTSSGLKPIAAPFKLNEKLIKNKKLSDYSFVIELEKRELFSVEATARFENGETVSSEYYMLCR